MVEMGVIWAQKMLQGFSADVWTVFGVLRLHMELTLTDLNLVATSANGKMSSFQYITRRQQNNKVSLVCLVLFKYFLLHRSFNLILAKILQGRICPFDTLENWCLEKEQVLENKKADPPTLDCWASWYQIYSHVGLSTQLLPVSIFGADLKPESVFTLSFLLPHFASLFFYVCLPCIVGSFIN